MKWTPGGLLLVSLAAWAVSAYSDLSENGGGFLFSLLWDWFPAPLRWPMCSGNAARRFQKFEEGLPAALDLMVSGLRGGHSLVSVIGTGGARSAGSDRTRISHLLR